MNYLNGNIILRYITDQCDEMEKMEFESWMKASRGNEQTYQYFRNVMSGVTV